VQGKDASENFLDEHPYSVCFQVIFTSNALKCLTYPNPFSTQTQFIFTTTGEELPDN